MPRAAVSDPRTLTRYRTTRPSRGPRGLGTWLLVVVAPGVLAQAAADAAVANDPFGAGALIGDAVQPPPPSPEQWAFDAAGQDVGIVGSSALAPVQQVSWQQPTRLRQQPPAAAGQREASLLSRLDAARTAEAALMAENQLLREQLKRWEDAGLEVAEREARVAELIQSRRRGVAAPALSAFGSHGAVAAAGAAEAAGQDDVLALVSSGVKTYMFDAGREPLDARTNALRLLTIFACANGLAFLGWTFSGSVKARLPFIKKPDGAVDAEEDLGESPSRRRVYGSMGNVVATAKGPRFNEPCATLEASDIYAYGLGPLLRRNAAGFADDEDDGDSAFGGDVYVSAQVGDAREQRTRGVVPTPEGELRYSEERIRLQTLGARGAGGCVFRVVERAGGLLVGRDRCVATFELSEQELLQLARNRRGEHLAFPLDVPGGQEASSSGGLAAASGEQPMLAMRLKEEAGGAAAAGPVPTTVAGSSSRAGSYRAGARRP